MQDKIKAEIKAAMIAKEMDKLQVLRLISAAFTNELVSQGRPPTEPLSDEDCMKVIKRMAKQRKDSIEQFTAGGREDLALSEKAELAIVEALLPAQMTEKEIEMRVREKLEANPIDATKKGMFMGTMMKELGDTADGMMVKAVIDRLVA
ncbi:MAG: GatB/YqeY domain-containing protein [Candidatus Paceibacterota bacterium]